MLCWKTVAALSSMFADRAPSSHNSKPWGIPVCREVEGGACCEIIFSIECSRALVANKHVAREVFISLGCYIALFDRAMKTFGCSRLSLEYLEERSIDSCSDLLLVERRLKGSLLMCVAKYSVDSEGRGEDVHDSLLKGLLRKTYRGDFREEQDVSVGEDRGRFWSYNSDSDCARIRVMDHESFEIWLSLYGEYGFRDYSDPAVWRETHSWIHGSPSAAQRVIGLRSGDVLGPLLSVDGILNRVLLHPRFSPQSVREARARSLASSGLRGLRDAKGILVAWCDTDSCVFDLVELGEQIFDLWVCAEEAGYAVWPISVLTQYEDTRARLQSCLGLKEGPVFCAPFGVPAHS